MLTEVKEYKKNLLGSFRLITLLSLIKSSLKAKLNLLQIINIKSKLQNDLILHIFVKVNSFGKNSQLAFNLFL
jgi:hypothetical protein